ncbi:hypothetical protein Tco_0814032 [Tanacetum coccineum]
MTTTAAQQVTLDNALVPQENREDFVFQIDNRDTKKQEKMYYPRFTKAIIHHFINKDKTISIRNRLFMHTAQDDDVLTYKTYLAYATGDATPKKARNFKKLASLSKNRTLIIVEEEEHEHAKKVVSSKKPSRKQSIGVQIKDTPGVYVSKKKTPAIAGGSGDGIGSKPGVPDEPKGKSVDASEGTSLKPRVLDVSKADSSKDFEYHQINDKEEDTDNEFIHTPPAYVPTDNETKGVDEEEYERINKILDKEARTTQDQVAAQAQPTHTATTELPLISSSRSISSIFTNAMLNIENLNVDDTEATSPMDIEIQH